MLVHDDKGGQLESSLPLVALESFPKKPGIGFDHEQAPALPGRESHEIRTRWGDCASRLQGIPQRLEAAQFQPITVRLKAVPFPSRIEQARAVLGTENDITVTSLRSSSDTPSRRPGLESSYVRLSTTQWVLLCVCLSLSSALSQTARKQSPKELPPTAFKLISVKTTGTQRYKSEEIVAASGLQIGQTVSEDDFKKAARLLTDTGAFGDVLYSFEYSAEGTKLELQVHDAEPFVPVRFDNLVWFSDQELLDQLHAAVPLFQGQLPVGGELADQVSNALQGLLIAHNVQGEANYLRAGPEDGPVEAFVFTVVGPQIHIRNIAFAGAGEAELLLLESAAKKLPGADFSRSILRAQEDKNFLPVYLQRGYLKATFGDAQAKVVEGSPQETTVDVTFPVDPGRQYRLAAIEIAGYKSFSAESLRALMRTPLGEPANAVQLDTDIEAMKKLYGTRGYMTASIQPDPELDDTNSTVRYVLRIQEGEVYSMGDLEIRGLDSRMSARLEDDWRLRAGDPYDSSYPKQFLDREDKEIPVMSDWDVNVRESVNQKEHTVDVTLRFNPKAR
jgi:outer membrane protein assembly factor BamA